MLLSAIYIWVRKDVHVEQNTHYYLEMYTFQQQKKSNFDDLNVMSGMKNML